MTERITSAKVHNYVEWLRGSGFDLSTSEDICGIVVTNRAGDTRVSHAGKPREIMNYFLRGYLAGWNARKKEKDNEPTG